MKALEKRHRRLDDLEVESETTGNLDAGQLAGEVQELERQLDGEIEVDAGFLERARRRRDQRPGALDGVGRRGH